MPPCLLMAFFSEELISLCLRLKCLLLETLLHLIACPFYYLFICTEVLNSFLSIVNQIPCCPGQALILWHANGQVNPGCKCVAMAGQITEELVTEASQNSVVRLFTLVIGAGWRPDNGVTQKSGIALLGLDPTSDRSSFNRNSKRIQKVSNSFHCHLPFVQGCDARGQRALVWEGRGFLKGGELMLLHIMYKISKTAGFTWLLLVQL